MSTDQAIEKEIQAKGLTAPRITPADIEAAIAYEHYFTAAHGVSGALSADELFCRHADTDTANHQQLPACTAYEAHRLLTFCILVLRNGFTVTGESACASPENFDAEMGRKIARQAAINKVWPLMGFELRTKLASGEKPEHFATMRRAMARLMCVSSRADIAEMRKKFEGDESVDREDIEAVFDCLSVLEQTATE